MSALLAGQEATAQCEYQVTVIQGPWCGEIFEFPPTYATGLNDMGEVVGYYTACTVGSDTAFLWTQASGLLLLPFPPGTSRKQAYDINDSGQIVGRADYSDDGLDVLAFLHDGDTLINLGVPREGNSSSAFAINDEGQVVGKWENTLTGPIAAFLWQDGEMSTLDLPLRPYSVATDINARGDAVGWMGDLFSDARAYVWDGGNVTTLPAIPGGLTSMATAISDRGDVVGEGLFPLADPMVVRSFVWKDDTMIDLGTLPGTTFARARDVNERGQIVGYCHNAGLTDSSGFMWQSGIMWNINDLLLPGSDTHVKFVHAINDCGEIVGTAVHGSGDTVGVILTPVNQSRADIDGDCRVSTSDLLILIGQWGPCDNCTADIDNDGIVGESDLELLLDSWS